MDRIHTYQDDNGLLHREDGPALEYHDGTKFWYMHGKLHRTDGPAIEYAANLYSWYINDSGYTFNDWLKRINASPEEKTLLVLKYGQ